MKYSMCIFDLDGTLLDTIEDLTDAVNYSLKKFGLPLRTKEEITSFVGNGIPQLVSLAALPLTDEKIISELYKITSEYYSLHYDIKTKPYDGINGLIDYLYSKGVKICVISNKNDDTSKKLINEFFGKKISLTFGRRDNIPKKPDPYTVFEAADILKEDISNAVFIGDSDIDVRTAHAAGIKCIGVSWGYRDADNLKEADYIINKAEEIYELI